MSLLAKLVRGRRVEGSATANHTIPAIQPAERAEPVAEVAGLAVATISAQDGAAKHVAVWLLHFHDRDPLTVVFAPAVTHAEVLAAYRTALAAEPLPEPLPVPLPPGRLAMAEACILAGLLTDDDRPALTRMFALDPEGTCRLIEDLHAQVPTCRHCTHYRRPGLSGGHCTGRDDLPLVYGLLHELPANSGAECKAFLPNGQ